MAADWHIRDTPIIRTDRCDRLNFPRRGRFRKADCIGLAHVKYAANRYN